MCCHRLYIYTVCGHSAFSERPLVLCRNAEIPPHGCYSTVCELIAHPYQSWKLEQLCPPCQHQRDQLMGRFESSQVVKFDQWRWKVSYGMPEYGKDFWGRKADKREEDAKGAKSGNKEKSRRFSLKRKSRKNTPKEET